MEDGNMSVSFFGFFFFSTIWNKVVKGKKKEKKQIVKVKKLGNQMNMPWVEQITKYYFVVVRKYIFYDILQSDDWCLF